MHIFIDIGLILFGTLISIGFYFIFEKIQTSFFSFIFNYGKNVISGSILGLFALLIYVIIQFMSHQFFLPWFFVIALSLIITKKPIEAGISIFPSLIYISINEPIDFYSYYNIFVLFSLFITFLVSNFFVSRLMAIIITFTVFSFLIPIGMTISYIVYSSTIDLIYFEKNCILFFASFIYIVALEYSIKFLKSANILFESINYTFGSYYRHIFMQKAFYEKINLEKISKGIITVFRVITPKNLTPAQNKELKETVLKKIEKDVKEFGLLFNVSLEHNGFFISSNYLFPGLEQKPEMISKCIAWIDNLFRKYSLIYVDSLGQKNKIKIVGGCSIYGEQSSSLKKLEEHALFALSTKSESDFLGIYNPNSRKKAYKDSNKLKLLQNSISLDQFTNMYFSVLNVNDLKQKIYYASIKNKYNHELIKDIPSHISTLNWSREFGRYFALDALNQIRKIPNGKIAFTYPSISSDKDLDVGAIWLKINKMKLLPENIVFILNREYPFYRDIAISNLNKLRQNGFLLGIESPSSEEDVKLLDFDYIFISKEPGFDILDKDKIVFTSFNQKSDIKFIKEHGIKNVCGELLNHGQNIINFNKQSKIYLERLIKEV